MTTISAPEWPFPFWIAHRGAGVDAPENTMAAFDLGAAYGFRAFECDVKLSRDSIPFLLHDDTLDRTTNGFGNPAMVLWQDIAQLDAGFWHSHKYSGERVPDLDAVVAWAMTNSHYLNLEIKPTTGREMETGRVVASLVQRLFETKGQAQSGTSKGESGSLIAFPLLSSFHADCLRGASEVAPSIPRALLVGRTCDSAIDDAVGLGCKALVFKADLIDANLIQQCHSRSLRVLAFTVNDLLIAEQLEKFGIDGLITDNISMLTSEVM